MKASSRLNTLVNEYFDVLDQIAELQAIAESIKESVRAEMVDCSEEEIEGVGWRATWHNTVTSRFDQKAMKAAHPEIYESFLKPATSTRFTLNKIRS